MGGRPSKEVRLQPIGQIYCHTLNIKHCSSSSSLPHVHWACWCCHNDTFLCSSKYKCITTSTCFAVTVNNLSHFSHVTKVRLRNFSNIQFFFHSVTKWNTTKYLLQNNHNIDLSMFLIQKTECWDIIHGGRVKCLYILKDWQAWLQSCGVERWRTNPYF